MKTIQEINEKIRSGKAVTLTAEEIVQAVKKDGIKKTARRVDVVTTATFGPMCSSGIYFNIGHATPRIKLGGGKATLNDVPCYAGFAAIDLQLGANALPDSDPRNSIYPGKFAYGGGHVIADLVAGKKLPLKAEGYGTDCYPRTSLHALIGLQDMNEAVLFNFRNCYQNYNVAVNSSPKVIYTYMGILMPEFGNAAFCSAGQLSPLLNDPLYSTIGIGTKIFLGGAQGYVAWWGTQHNPGVARTEKGVPKVPAGTLALIGNLKEMESRWLVGTSMTGYGATLSVGVGIPIPILNEDILAQTAIEDREISAPIVDYAHAYPETKNEVLGYVNYAQLKSGTIEWNGKKIPTGSLSSIRKAREIAHELKNWVEQKKFVLSEPVGTIPSADSGYRFHPLKQGNAKE
ncbi:MAG: hypothetical protein GF333_07515 [Candidatus Omnitrophica bacterium]|nr:hypothetical protein [Candidatus Omnitrophota bacterium]